MKLFNNTDDFVKKCLEDIRPEPLDRLGPAAKKVYERDNFVFDNHCHIFDGGCVDEKYFILRMLANLPNDVAREIFKRLFGASAGIRQEMEETIEERIYSDPPITESHQKGLRTDFWYSMEQRTESALLELKNESTLKRGEEQAFLNFGLREILKRIRNIISILKRKSMKHVLNVFEQQYAINRLVQGSPELLTVVLGMDLNMGWGYGRDRNLNIEKSQNEQNAELLSLARNRAIIPFFPIDPRRADLKDEKENLYTSFYNAFTSEVPFFGVKVYPALGYLPTDSRLDPIFKVCEELKIPVLTHCGGTTVSTFQKEITVDHYGTSLTVPGRSRKEKASYLNHPERWRDVLDEHKNLHLNLAHFGSLSEWEKDNFASSDRITCIIDLMQAYKVYSDFSFNLDSEEATINFINALNENSETGRLLTQRALFGTDFWVILPSSDLNADQQYFIEKSSKHFADLAIENGLRFLHL